MVEVTKRVELRRAEVQNPRVAGVLLCFPSSSSLYSAEEKEEEEGEGGRLGEEARLPLFSMMSSFICIL